MPQETAWIWGTDSRRNDDLTLAYRTAWEARGKVQEGFSSCEASGSHRNVALGTGWEIDWREQVQSSAAACSASTSGGERERKGESGAQRIWGSRGCGAAALHPPHQQDSDGAGQGRGTAAQSSVTVCSASCCISNLCAGVLGFLLPRLGCDQEGAWVGLGSGWDMKLCPSASRAGIATFALSNDKPHELWVTARSLCGWIDVEINSCLITYST